MNLKPHLNSPRRKDRTISACEAQDIIERGQYAILALHSVDKYPYCLPINYVKDGNSIYFHCANEGKKLDCIANNPLAMLCVVEDAQVVPEEFSTNYSSAMAFGSIKVCESEEERTHAFQMLIKKFAPQHIAAGQKMISNASKRAKILRFDIETISGKARRQNKSK